MKRARTWTLLVLSVIASANFACGRVSPSGSAKSADTSQLSNTQSTMSLTQEFTAEYSQKPVDVLVMRENSNRINSQAVAATTAPAFPAAQYPFGRKLFVNANMTDGVPRAMKNFAARLFYAPVDFRLAVVETVFANDAAAATGAGSLLSPAGESGIINRDTASFLDVAERRPNAITERNDINFHYPYKALQGVLTKSSAPVGATGFLRNGAMLAVLYIGYSDEIKESMESSDMIAALDASRGPGNWVVWAIMPDEAGCEWHTGRHTNEDYFTAPSTAEQWASYKRKNKMHKLVKHSGGKYKSLCFAPTDTTHPYMAFIDQFVNEGMSQAFISVKLDKKPVAESIKITVNGSEVEGWRYDPNNEVLMVPTTIKSGTKFSVTYDTVVTVAGTIYNGPSGGGEVLSDISGGVISQRQIQFNDSVRAVFATNCNGCHNNRYNNFDFANGAGKTPALTRISNSTMPPAGSTITAGDRTILLEWLSGT